MKLFEFDTEIDAGNRQLRQEHKALADSRLRIDRGIHSLRMDISDGLDPSDPMVADVIKDIANENIQNSDLTCENDRRAKEFATVHAGALMHNALVLAALDDVTIKSDSESNTDLLF